MFKKLSTLFLTLIMSTQLAACTTSSDSTRSGATISGDNPTATIETRLGTFELELFADKIPEISKNFIELAKAGKYDGVPFHRVIKDFMIQGGDFENKNGTGGHSYKGPGTELAGEFDSEVSSNLRGTIAMANRGPDTNGSQFFINLVDNTRLDHDKAPLSSAHPVFGKVIEGMDVVDAIGKVQTGPGDRPAEEVLMTKVTIQE